MKKLLLFLLILGNLNLLVANETWKSIIKSRSGWVTQNDFEKIGIKTPEEAKKWCNILGENNPDYTISYIKSYMKLGLNSPEAVLKWKNAGLEPFKWIDDAHITNIEEAKNWKDSGIHYPYEVSHLKEIGIKTPKELKQWIKAGIPKDKIYTWKENNINTSKEAKQWVDVGIDNPYYLTSKLKKQGINTPNKIKNWKNVGVAYRDILEWKKLNIKTSKKAKNWIDIGVRSPKLLKSLKYIGINTPKEYKPYKGINTKYIVKLKEWKIKPNNLIASMSNRNSVWGVEIFFNSKENFLKAYNGLKGNCQEIENKFFATVDMYDNKDKCYVFIAKLIQRVDKHHGLADGSGHRYIYLNFNGNWREGSSKIGIVKGNEVFSYEIQNGSIKSVPQGKVLFSKK